MKQFAFRILIFGICLLLINSIFYKIVNEYYYKDYNNINLSYHAYMLSDSHGTPLKNTEKYGVYNFSAASDSYFDMYIKVKFLIKNTDLKKIIITVDNHTLSKYRENANNLDRSAFYRDRTDYTSLFEYIKVKYLKNYIVLINPGGRNIVRAFFKSKLIRTDKKKSITKWEDLTLNEQKDNSIKRATEHFPYEQHSRSLIAALEDIIDLCRKNKVEIVGIKFPLSNEYINAIKNKNYKADSIFYMQDLKVYDFKNIFIKENFYFFDPDHLNELGGQEFVKILAEKVF